ncbi:insulin like 5 [Phyllostomus discolor]|uniref:Insulin like 5 n=1 Tax=Phyllostomus discolor TaxID=89673 RepID=A0A6J2LLZ2_9CHIR|nr:insulin-like peptide INSL5 [Phyllostomus discolor]KAF6109174.1 insulin like 5 [Phyllostomus discolor]
MKASIFTLFLFSVLLATSEVTSAKSVKLCGREYVRTVVYICASSRWRRYLEGTPQVQQAERENYFQLPNEHQVSEESIAQNLLKVDSVGQESLQQGQLPTEGLWGAKKHSVMSRRDLQTLCCTSGCSMADLSALC